MKFFKQNINNDLNYLEISTKFNLAYWIACDLKEYGELYSKELNNYEYQRMQKQYDLAVQIYNEAEDLLQFVDAKYHKESLYALKNYVSKCIRSCSLDSIVTSNIDSENEEIQLNILEQDFNKFVNKYINHVIEDSFDYVLLDSFRYFHLAEKKMLELNSQFEFIDINKSISFAEKIVEDLMTARIIIDQGLQNDLCHDQIIDDFMLSINENKFLGSKENCEHFYNLSIQYLRLWREVYYIHEEFYKDQIIHKFALSEPEMDLFLHNAKKYYAQIYKNAIEINILILDNMGIKMPDIDVYCARKVKEPLDLIARKVLR